MYRVRVRVKVRVRGCLLLFQLGLQIRAPIDVD